ncbi:hypothetical protein HYU14_05610 [Candidatus Woesearchaeota archaeon]|nr:hypothetical protein [Candidatus Woesearchaeota archaeon]
MLKESQNINRFAKLLFITLLFFLIGISITLFTYRLFPSEEPRSALFLFLAMGLLFASALAMIVRDKFPGWKANKLNRLNELNQLNKLQKIFSFHPYSSIFAAHKTQRRKQQESSANSIIHGFFSACRKFDRNFASSFKSMFSPKVLKSKSLSGRGLFKGRISNKEKAGLMHLPKIPTRDYLLGTEQSKKIFYAASFLFGVITFFLGFFWRIPALMALSLILMFQTLAGYRALNKSSKETAGKKPRLEKILARQNLPAGTKGKPNTSNASGWALQKPVKIIPYGVTLVIGKNQTDLDAVYALLESYGKIKISAIAKFFQIDHKMAEEWAAILQDHDLAEIHYPAFGGPELRKWNKEKPTA